MFKVSYESKSAMKVRAYKYQSSLLIPMKFSTYNGQSQIKLAYNDILYYANKGGVQCNS